MVDVRLPTTVTNELAYLCGVFAGDGSINYRADKHEYSLTVVGNPHDEKEYYHEVIGPMMKRVFGVFPNMKALNKDTTFGFNLYSKKLVNFLTKKIGLPLGSKYEHLCIPPIFKQNDDFVISFICGLFDTDGCISFKRRYKKFQYYPCISASSKSKKFFQEIYDYHKILGVNFCNFYTHKITDNRLKKGFNIISRIEIQGYQNCEFWLATFGFKNSKHQKKIKKFWKEK